MIQLVALEAILQVSLSYFNIHSSHTIATVHYIRVLKRSLEKPIKAKDVTGVGIWETNPWLGHSHIMNASGTHKTENFNVTYTIGPDRNRLMPKPENPRGRIVFLGGSITFGYGVEEDQSFPAVLASQYLPEFEIVNKGVVGYGTMHSYMALLEELKGGNPPSLVVYGYIPHHTLRNYIRKSWVSSMGKNGIKHPHFEIKDKKLQFQGLVGVEEGLEDSDAVTEKELELTSAFIVAMHEECEKRNIPFAVLLLPTHYSYQEYIISTIFDHDIKLIDQSHGSAEGFLTDEHLNPQDYSMLAKAISKPILLKTLDNISAPH